MALCLSCSICWQGAGGSRREALQGPCHEGKLGLQEGLQQLPGSVQMDESRQQALQALLLQLLQRQQ